jgi:hypothetical protein
VVDQHASFSQDFSPAAIVQGIAQMQPHGTEDNVSFEVALFGIGRDHSWQVFDEPGSTSPDSLYQLSSYS